MLKSGAGRAAAWLLCICCLLGVGGGTATANEAGRPPIDKAKLESYLRYAEGFMANVHFQIEDPVASPYPGFYKLAVHLSMDNGAKLDRTYYLTTDGKEIVNGTIWATDQSPFSANLERMPNSGYAFGPADAKVQLVIFSDFECPYCRQFAKTVRDNIPQKYPKDVRVVFQDFPIDSLHPWARAAAEASHCVGDQSVDEFWRFHDWIFAHAEEIKPENLSEKIMGWEKDQPLDGAKLQSCMASHEKAGVVKQSEAAGKLLGVEKTPTIFVDGRMIPGALPWESLNSVIQLELTKPARF